MLFREHRHRRNSSYRIITKEIEKETITASIVRGQNTLAPYTRQIITSMCLRSKKARERERERERERDSISRIALNKRRNADHYNSNAKRLVLL
jgi:hypothetical protein